MLWLLITVFIGVGLYFWYCASTPEGLDWKKGIAALVALGAAFYAWLAGLFQSAPPV